MAFISIVIPTYNEAKRIGKTLSSIRHYRKAQSDDFELIISDDGSRDDTCDIVERETKGMQCHLMRESHNKGKGHAVRKGILASRGEFVLFSDADLSTPIEELDKMLAGLRDGADVVCGSRALENSDVQIHQNILRETMGKVFNLFARTLVFAGIHDSQCGFKCFRREAAHRLFSLSKLDGFCFDAEIVYLAQKLGFRIKEVPVVWRNDAKSKVSILLDPIRMFLDLFRIRWLHRNTR